MHHTFARVRSCQRAFSTSDRRRPRVRAHSDIWAADITCACAPAMSQATWARLRAGARDVRWWRVRRNAATFSVEIRGASLTVASFAIREGIAITAGKALRRRAKRSFPVFPKPQDEPTVPRLGSGLRGENRTAESQIGRASCRERG